MAFNEYVYRYNLIKLVADVMSNNLNLKNTIHHEASSSWSSSSSYFSSSSFTSLLHIPAPGLSLQMLITQFDLQ